MKKIVLTLLLTIFITSGCGNTQKLTCTASNTNDDIKSSSEIAVKIKDDRVVDMKFTVDMKFPKEYQSQLQNIANNIKASKPYMQVTLIDGGIRLVTNDDRDSFIGIEMDQKITYGELKGMLELQDYTCK